MIRHGQFLQDVESLASMYSICDDVAHGGGNKHPHWIALQTEGPMEQLHILQAEMHEYLKLPAILPAAENAAADRITTRDGFRLGVERLQRMYRALGSVRLELAQFHPALYSASVEQFLVALATANAALHRYLRWEELQTLLSEMEQKYTDTDNAGVLTPAVPSTSVPEPHSHS